MVDQSQVNMDVLCPSPPRLLIWRRKHFKAVVAALVVSLVFLAWHTSESKQKKSVAPGREVWLGDVVTPDWDYIDDSLTSSSDEYNWQTDDDNKSPFVLDKTNKITKSDATIGSDVERIETELDEMKVESKKVLTTNKPVMTTTMKVKTTTTTTTITTTPMAVERQDKLKIKEVNQTDPMVSDDTQDEPGSNQTDLSWLERYNRQRKSVEDLMNGVMPPINRSIHIFNEKEVADQPADLQNRVFPHALIIGARKAGTSALRDFLALHPDIKAPNTEPGFFFSDPVYTKGLAFYRTKLPSVRPNQISIEKSAEYFHCSHVPERVRTFNSSMKLLLIVRDPFVRLVSDYMFLQRYQRKEDTLIEKMFSFEDIAYNETTKEINTKWGCLKRSVYYIWFQEWLKFFPRKQILVVNGEDFSKDNPGRELSRVEKFLGVRPLLSEKRFYFNETKGFYCVKQIGCLQENKGHQPLSVAAHIEEKIREYLQPLNLKFYDLVGENFGWR